MNERTNALPRDTIIAVVGAGTMGSGIAQVAASAGHAVLLFDLSEEATERGVTAIADTLRNSVAKGRIAAEERTATLARIKACSSLSDLADAGLVIEAVAESLDAKRGLFSSLETIVAAGCILATNTSSISIEAIGAELKRPGRLAGLHFFNPAPIMALVEVISGRATDPSVAACIEATATAWGKTPVRARSTPGFIVNRVARPFYAEALRVLAEGGAEPATIDAVVRESGGFRMGPCELMDLIGHDVNYAVTKSVWEAFHYDLRFQPSLVQREFVEAGWLGRKSGRGFYDYRGGPTPVAATAPASAAPASVTIAGQFGFAGFPMECLQKAGIVVEEVSGSGELRFGNVVLAPTDGRLATERAAQEGREVVLFDWTFDFSAATRIAIAPARQTSAAAVSDCAGLFQVLGKNVSVMEDVPGLIVARTVSMLANEAADALNQQVANARSIDTAMTKGVNYPVGPLSWADRIGVEHVLAVLDNLARTYGEDRYRASPLLRTCALANIALHSFGRDDT